MNKNSEKSLEIFEQLKDEEGKIINPTKFKIPVLKEGKQEYEVEFIGSGEIKRFSQKPKTEIKDYVPLDTTNPCFKGLRQSQENTCNRFGAFTNYMEIENAHLSDLPLINQFKTAKKPESFSKLKELITKGGLFKDGGNPEEIGEALNLIEITNFNFVDNSDTRNNDLYNVNTKVENEFFYKLFIYVCVIYY